MAADKRAFAVFDVGYLDNPKISDVFDASCIAVCMHFASVLYCAQHLTDGVIALRFMERKCGGTPDDSRLLIEAGLWHLPGHDCPSCPEVPPGKAYVHDYLSHNRTSDGVKEKSDVGRRNAKARWDKAKAEAEANATGMQTASEPQSSQQSKPAEPAMQEPMLKTEETDRKKELLKDSSDQIKNEFIDWYAEYPLKQARPAAERAYIKARRTVSAETLMAGMLRYRDDPNRNPGYTKQPATWLNNAGWEDDPQPDRTTAVATRQGGAQLQLVGGHNRPQQPQRATGTTRAMNTLDLAAQIAQEEEEHDVAF